MTAIDTAALWDTLDGLCAYDLGARDSGIHDEDLRARTKEQFAAMARGDRWRLVSGLIRDHVLTDDRFRAGYRLIDLEEFIQWLRYEMDVDL